MKLDSINRLLSENVEKLTPHLANYICSLISMPFKAFIKENGLLLKTQFEEYKTKTGNDILDVIASAMPTSISVRYGDEYLKNAKPYGFHVIIALYAMGIIPTSHPHLTAAHRNSLSGWNRELMATIHELLTFYSKYVGEKLNPSEGRPQPWMLQSLIPVIDRKDLSSYNYIIKQILNCDPIYHRDMQHGGNAANSSAPFAKVIANWVYNPYLETEIRLPDDGPFLREQLAVFNKAKSKGLTTKIDDIPSYGHFMEVMKPYSKDLEKVDRYELAGLPLVAQVDQYKIYDLIWVSSDINSYKHAVIGDSGWCVRDLNTYESYKKPLFFVAKGNKKYALLSFASGRREYKDVYNKQLRDADAAKVLYALLSKDRRILDLFITNVCAANALMIGSVRFLGDYDILNTNMGDEANEYIAKIKDIILDVRSLGKVPMTVIMQNYDQGNVSLADVATFIKRQNLPTKLNQLYDSHPEFVRWLLSKFDTKEKEIRSHFDLGNHIQELENDFAGEGISVPVGKTWYAYEGSIRNAYLRWMASSATTSKHKDAIFKHVLQVWAKSTLSIIKRGAASGEDSSNYRRKGFFSGLPLNIGGNTDILKNIFSEAKTVSAYEELKNFIINNYGADATVDPAAKSKYDSGSYAEANAILFIRLIEATGDTNWTEGMENAEALITRHMNYVGGKKLSAEERNLFNRIIALGGMKVGYANINDPATLYDMLEEADQRGLDIDVKAAEKRLADLDLKYAISYAINVKGPWRYLEKKLKEYHSSGQADSQKLIDLYKEQVLYGEEYE